jgi:hypothetical protein
VYNQELKSYMKYMQQQGVRNGCCRAAWWQMQPQQQQHVEVS